ncbi:MAG: flagellar export protein FliJ [Candidatus Sulfotelmatobacter sp.]
MSFHFPLAAVLRYRESLEQREYFALEKLQQEITQVDQRIRQVEEDCFTAMQTRAAELDRGIPAAEVQAAYEYQRALQRQLEALSLRLQELKIKWQQQLAVYELARRNRETLDKLREKQFDAHTREQAKREQSVIDDLFLARRGRSH